MNPNQRSALAGAGCAFLAFVIWGVSPVYWKILHSVSSFEVILHRIIWSFVVLMPLVLLRNRRSEFVRTLKDLRAMGILLFTSVMVSANWLIYVWAVNNQRVLEASLGYYINPIVNVLLGVIFLKERLRPIQIFAVILAGAGVLYLTISQGAPPWVSLSLAFSFGIYGLIRKVVSVSALTGLTVETLLLTIPAFILLGKMEATGTAAFLNMNLTTDLLLAGTGILTATPLLLFGIGARRITLTTLGFIQYTGPTGMLLLGITLFDEPFTRVQMVTFGLIWTALALYSTDAWLVYKKNEQKM